MTFEFTRQADRFYDDIWLPEETLKIRTQVRAFVETQRFSVRLEESGSGQGLYPFTRTFQEEQHDRQARLNVHSYLAAKSLI